MKQRIEYIDLAKGICISLVVLLHVYGDLSGAFIKIMNLFRMPLYFVLSGLFFKTYDGLFPFLKKKTNKLLIPFIFTFVFVIVPATLLLDMKDGLTISIKSVLWGTNGKLNLGIDGASWFLLCLFLVNILFYLIFLLTKRNIVGITVTTFTCGIIGYALSRFGIWLPLWLDSSLTAMPFFMMGYFLRNYSNILYGRLTIRDTATSLVLFLLLLIVYWFDETQSTGIIIYGNNDYDINIFSLYFGGFAGSYCILILSKRFGHLPGLSYIGRYSIVVLLTHLLYLFLFRNILYQLGIPQDGYMLNMLVYVLIMLLSLPTIKFCISCLPYWFAQKDLFK